ncbi:MAG TPA: DUF177 domain-containing protein [Solirubrobacteraceae bacterium]|nr:DUF177 domain-containing protein [Solirubrobacteraceae bacterium]
MSIAVHDLDLASLRLSSGEGRRLELAVRLGESELGGERYGAAPPQVPAALEVSRMTGGGHALRLRFAATLAGPCMRCLKDARLAVTVDAREVDVPGEGEELSSPYVEGDTLDLSAWAHDAFVLALPAQVLCREDCAGLCPLCAADLNEAGPEHSHEREPDPRWAKLRELKLD